MERPEALVRYNKRLHNGIIDENFKKLSGWWGTSNKITETYTDNTHKEVAIECTRYPRNKIDCMFFYNTVLVGLAMDIGGHYGNIDKFRKQISEFEAVIFVNSESKTSDGFVYEKVSSTTNGYKTADVYKTINGLKYYSHSYSKSPEFNARLCFYPKELETYLKSSNSARYTCVE